MSRKQYKRRSLQEAPAAMQPRPNTGGVWLVLIIVVAGLAVYLTSLNGAFILDDSRCIVNNESIRQLWPLDTRLLERRPVVNLSLAINYAVGGLEPFGYHVANILVHILAAMTLFGIIRRSLLLDPLRKTHGAAAPWLAFVSALFWVVHPLQTQSVTYIVQRAESMMGLFYLLTLYCLIRSATTRRAWIWHAGSVVCCALGMGSKAVMVTAPVVMLLYDRAFLCPSFAQALRARWQLYLGLGATWIVLFLSGVATGVLNPNATGLATVGFAFKGISPLQYLATQPGVILYYLRLAFWPMGLCLDHGWPPAKEAGQILSQSLLIVALLAGTLWAYLRRPCFGFLGVWFFVILAPTSSFVPIRDVMFEHRMYLSLAAVVCVVVFGAYRAAPRILSQAGTTPAGRRILAVVMVAILVSPLAIATVQRNKVYRSSLAIWQDTAAKAPHSARAQNNLGCGLADSGRTLEAIEQFCKALRINPNYERAHFNLANSLTKLGRWEEAIPGFRVAIELDPSHVEAHSQLGKALAAQGQTEEALGAFDRTVSLQPDHVDARVNLGVMLGRLGRHQEAAVAYKKAIEIDPGHADAHYNFARTLAAQNKVEESIGEYRAAITANASFLQARVNLAIALADKGQTEEAISEYRAAISLDPDFFLARLNLGHLLARLDRKDEAIRELREAVRIDPANAQAGRYLDVLQRPQSDSPQ
ncbi:MAG: tetratricopeptide repeat protein [Planctomycetota bacterium]